MQGVDKKINIRRYINPFVPLEHKNSRSEALSTALSMSLKRCNNKDFHNEKTIELLNKLPKDIFDQKFALLLQSQAAIAKH